jgi:hypothetical protein
MLDVARFQLQGVTLFEASDPEQPVDEATDVRRLTRDLGQQALTTDGISSSEQGFGAGPDTGDRIP